MIWKIILNILFKKKFKENAERRSSELKRSSSNSY
jgi:hypothetical protein